MSNNSRGKRRSAAILAGFCIKSSEARSWWSIDISEIENIRNNDPVFKEASQLLLEDTYFLFGQDDLNTGISTPGFEVSQQWPTKAPISTQNPTTGSPVVSPTLSPSMTYQAVNGGCHADQILHRLWLYDSYDNSQYGDGWGTTTLQIRNSLSSDVLFGGTLDAQLGAIQHAVDANIIGEHAKTQNNDQQRGLENISEGNGLYICLSENACYTGEISGGTFQEECSWELTRVDLETGNNIDLIAKGIGSGTGKCEFGLSDKCVQTCDGKSYFLSIC